MRVRLNVRSGFSRAYSMNRATWPRMVSIGSDFRKSSPGFVGIA
jgi:hypothetical protein